MSILADSSRISTRTGIESKLHSCTLPSRFQRSGELSLRYMS